MTRRPILLLLAGLLSSAPLATRASDLQPFERGSWETLRAAHAGHPTVVHFWGLTCAPCLAELPRWGELVRERPDLHVVLVAADQLADDDARISATLEKAGLATVESWGFADRFAARLRYEIDPRWHGELPRTLLIAGDGGTTTFPGVADLAEVRAWADRQAGPRSRSGALR
jgi:thiol-disulfide isomerase/thioredoxin